MHLSSIQVDIQRKGIYIGQRHCMVKFALSNTESPYMDIPLEGKEYAPEEVLAELKDFKKQKPEMICFTGGEPLLQIDYYRDLLEELPLPLYFETNATVPERIADVKDYVSMFCLQLLPAYQKEFIESMIAVRDSDYYVRLIIEKDMSPKEIEDYAKIIASVNDAKPLILEPLFGVKNYLALQAMALRHLKDVRVIPRMHL